VGEAAEVPDSGDIDDSDADTETGTRTGAGATDPAVSESPAPTAPRFLVNYESDSDFGPPPTGQQGQDHNQDPPDASGFPASPSPPGYFSPLELGGLNLNRFPTPNQQQYFYN